MDQDFGKGSENAVVMKENAEKHLEEVSAWLWEDEHLLHAYGSWMDLAALTTRRLLFVDRSVRKSGAVVVTVPYSRIESVSLEKAAFWSGRRKVLIQTRARTHALEFRSSLQAERFYDILADYVCRF